MTSESRVVPPSTWPLSVNCTFFYTNVCTLIFPKPGHHWKCYASDFYYLTAISCLPVLSCLNHMVSALLHCRTFHTLEFFCFSFLATLPWPQSFLPCNLDSIFYHFKYFRYLISSPLVSSLILLHKLRDQSLPNLASFLYLLSPPAPSCNTMSIYEIRFPPC